MKKLLSMRSNPKQNSKPKTKTAKPLMKKKRRALT